MSELSQLLLAISNALLVPDLVAALVLLGLALVELGLFLAELWVRVRTAGALREVMRGMRDARPEARTQAALRYLALDPVPPGIVFRLAWLGDAARSGPVRAFAVEDVALASERRLARLTACVRLGPMVGLIGTLIPLGPGLVALAGGDIARMASHLTVAFTVTVTGLATGALGFVLASARRNLDALDLARLGLVAAVIAECGEQSDERSVVDNEATGAASDPGR